MSRWRELAAVIRWTIRPWRVTRAEWWARLRRRDGRYAVAATEIMLHDWLA